MKLDTKMASQKIHIGILPFYAEHHAFVDSNYTFRPNSNLVHDQNHHQSEMTDRLLASGRYDPCKKSPDQLSNTITNSYFNGRETSMFGAATAGEAGYMPSSQLCHQQSSPGLVKM
jgi:hypothetical protein